ncbi:hypothetical protein [uncultured Thiodictyon sp.]|uniref:hypothetical protein n=1 Tax=uncultured Thiodictyon sp. TaxID=1846217 RepID=UPI0025E2B056|nr:hypothetical protein [uncultured Thiodictyon sp.]
MSINLILAEGQAMVRQGLAALLHAESDIALLAQAADGETAWSFIGKTGTDNGKTGTDNDFFVRLAIPFAPPPALELSSGDSLPNWLGYE